MLLDTATLPSKRCQHSTRRRCIGLEGAANTTASSVRVPLKHELRAERGGRRRGGGRAGSSALCCWGGRTPPPLAAGMSLVVQGGYRAVCGRSGARPHSTHICAYLPAVTKPYRDTPLKKIVSAASSPHHHQAAALRRPQPAPPQLENRQAACQNEFYTQNGARFTQYRDFTVLILQLYLTTALAALNTSLHSSHGVLHSASSTLVTEPGRYTDDDILTATEPGEHSVVRVSCVEMC